MTDTLRKRLTAALQDLEPRRRSIPGANASASTPAVDPSRLAEVVETVMRIGAGLEAADAQSAPVPRAEPSAEPSGLPLEVEVELLADRVAALEERPVVGMVEHVGPRIVECAACSGTGKPSPAAAAFEHVTVCAGCSGSGVHRV